VAEDRKTKEVKTELQVVIEKQRAIYDVQGIPPFLQQVCQMYRITIREFASIFGISKAHSENIIKQRKFPDLPLALSITRYFGCTVEELFGWRIDDDGKRRPLLIEDPRTGQAYRLSEVKKQDRTMSLMEKRLNKTEDG
jgi:DNA-binding XRE family transcriptional regulator